MSEKRGLALEELISYARRFGDECVMETAIEAGFPFSELVRLQNAIDGINEERDKARRFSRYRRPRKSAEDRVKKLLDLAELRSDEDVLVSAKPSEIGIEDDPKGDA